MLSLSFLFCEMGIVVLLCIFQELRKAVYTEVLCKHQHLVFTQDGAELVSSRFKGFMKGVRAET